MRGVILVNKAGASKTFAIISNILANLEKARVLDLGDNRLYLPSLFVMLLNLYT
jgi:hypothetical protein